MSKMSTKFWKCLNVTCLIVEQLGLCLLNVLRKSVEFILELKEALGCNTV